MIFCVEDDKNIQELILYALRNANFEAQGFYNVKDFKKALEQLPELILLDVMLPDQDGIDLLKELKNDDRFSEIPIIMITAKGSEYDKVLGLENGADDYITKPFSVIELIARIKAVRRRYTKKETNDALNFKNLSMNIINRTVTIDNKPLNLTLKEFEMLKLLLERPNMVLTREKLLDDIWGYDYFGETRTVDVHIRTLRSKLGNYAKYIKTIHGVGYKLVDNEE